MDFDIMMEHPMFNWRIDANELSGRIAIVLFYTLVAYIAYVAATCTLGLEEPNVIGLYSSIGIGVVIGMIVCHHSNCGGSGAARIAHTNTDTSRDETN